MLYKLKNIQVSLEIIYIIYSNTVKIYLPNENYLHFGESECDKYGGKKWRIWEFPSWVIF